MMTEETKALIAKRLRKAEESYVVAEEIRKGHPTMSVNRYYYAVYYTMMAALAARSESPKSHKGTISAFSHLYVASGEFPRADSRLIAKVFQWRTKGDYDDDEEYSLEEVETLRLPVKDFIDRVKQFLED